MEIESPLRHATDVVRRVTPPPQAGQESDREARAPISSPVYGGGAERALASEAEGGTVVAIARAWIGTPYVHQASVKGAGCDCLGLLRGVFRELRGEEPESPPPYSPDWAEANCAETLYSALLRHLTEIELAELSPGDIALFRMVPRGPAKHCAIVACLPPPERGRSSREVARVGVMPHDPSPDRCAIRPSLFKGGNSNLTLIHARQNKRVSEEAFTLSWRKKLAFAFRL